MNIEDGFDRKRAEDGRRFHGSGIKGAVQDDQGGTVFADDFFPLVLPGGFPAEAGEPAMFFQGRAQFIHGLFRDEKDVDSVFGKNEGLRLHNAFNAPQVIQGGEVDRQGGDVRRHGFHWGRLPISLGQHRLKKRIRRYSMPRKRMKKPIFPNVFVLNQAW